MTLVELSKTVDLEKIAIGSQIIAFAFLAYLFYSDSKSKKSPRKSSKK